MRARPRPTPSQDWAQAQPPFEIEGTGIWIQAQVEDLPGRFNLNSVVNWDQQNNTFVPDPHQIAVFRTLLRRSRHRPALRRPAGRLDRPRHRAVGKLAGGEDTLYLTQTPPYRPPNTFITHPSELLALPGSARELRQDRALRHRAALRRAGEHLHGQRAGARCHAQRSAEPERIRRRRTWSRRDKMAVFRSRPCTRASSRTRPSEARSRSASKRSRAGSACARTFVLALRSSFCTVSSSASPATKCAPCSAVSEANDR